MTVHGGFLAVERNRVDDGVSPKYSASSLIVFEEVKQYARIRSSFFSVKMPSWSELVKKNFTILHSELHSFIQTICSVDDPDAFMLK